MYERPELDSHLIGSEDDVFSPFTDFPSTDNPSTGNRPQINKDIQSKDLNKPPKAPRGARDCKDTPDWKPERFAGLWNYYPRHEKKQAAIKAWDKLRPNDELIDQIARALKRQVASDDWQREDCRFVPYLSSYLNGRRWEDEPRREPVSESDTGSYWADDEEVY